ncbi:helix-turn-helix domain-containing protein, partial [candidate division KSB1 bacterium]|nr:helix-turn-helix domain-containing protein [candidate division KSB1 bacterium]
MKNLLKVKRWEAGLKQYELAFLLGCSSTYLSLVENNRIEATKEFKKKAAEIFSVNVEDIFLEAPVENIEM